MSHALKTAGTKFLITQSGSLDAAVAACTAAGIPRKHIFLIEGDHKDFRSIQDLMEGGKWCITEPAYQIPAGKTNEQECAFLNFSSGTTGLPKAVMLSHHNMIAQCHQLRQLQVVEPGERYRILAIMPLFHITGLVRFCNYPVFMNGNSIMLPSFAMDSMLKAIVEFQVPEMILVPPILIRMVRDPVVEKYLPDLRRIVKRWSSGSAPTAPEIIELLRQKFPNTGFRQGYGATESTACISCHPPSHYDYKYATTGGILCANTVAKVIDLDDPNKELGPGQTGEICAKGPQIAMGYLNNPTASAETFQNGFFHTGDVGHLDEEGLFHIEDRIKEMIKVKGQQVPPAELEDLLLGHDLVEDCAVLGIPDTYAGERPKAYVVPKQGIEPSKDLGSTLLKFVKEKKVRYKWIVEIEFTDVVPKSPTGKLLRRVLKAKDREKDRVRGVWIRDEAERARL
jgi:acyl-CoA synthetase (AMP-forming)/AMP-acid ligase II